jgi:hypothetical protein
LLQNYCFYKIAFSHFQYGVSADIYSLTIILYELFSEINPFPGNIGQVLKAKENHQNPHLSSEFPNSLKDLMPLGWSKEPEKRPGLGHFKSALNTMLQDEKYIKTQPGSQNCGVLPNSQSGNGKHATQEEYTTATILESSSEAMEDDATTTKSLEDQKENPKFQRSPKLAHNQIRKGKDTSANKTEMAPEQKEEQRTKGVENSPRRELNEKHENQNKGNTEEYSI